MTGLLGFCAFMAFAYEPFDLFWKPVERDQEVWLGFTRLLKWAVGSIVIILLLMAFFLL